VFGRLRDVGLGVSCIPVTNTNIVPEIGEHDFVRCRLHAAVQTLCRYVEFRLRA
jgi:hypothetical protein